MEYFMNIQELSFNDKHELISLLGFNITKICKDLEVDNYISSHANKLIEERYDIILGSFFSWLIYNRGKKLSEYNEYDREDTCNNITLYNEYYSVNIYGNVKHGIEKFHSDVYNFNITWKNDSIVSEINPYHHKRYYKEQLHGIQVYFKKSVNENVNKNTNKIVNSKRYYIYGERCTKKEYNSFCKNEMNSYNFFSTKFTNYIFMQYVFDKNNGYITL